MSDNLSSGRVGLNELNIEEDLISSIDFNVFDKITVEKANQLRSGPNIYRMKANIRGYCVIIDNAEFTDIRLKRSGSRADADRLKKIFTQMGFDVKSYSDLTRGEMDDYCTEISQDQKLSEHDALVVIILSHGGDNGLICGKDYRESNGKKFGCVTDRQLLHVFNDEKCPLLKGKPKMFFFNCCRGSKVDKIQTDSVYNDELLSDVFAGYGTKDGYKGFRWPGKGSYFAIALAAKLIELSCDKELKDIFNQIRDYVQEMTAEDVNGKRFIYQSPTYVLYNWRNLYFNTGLDQTNSDLTEPIANTSTPKKNTNYDIELIEGDKNQIGGKAEMNFAENVPNTEAVGPMANIDLKMRAIKGEGNVINGPVKMAGFLFANQK